MPASTQALWRCLRHVALSRRTARVATLFPNEASLLRPVSAVLAEISEDWEPGQLKGKDLDGVEFKLSDYRGKVVLLDFLGH